MRFFEPQLTIVLGATVYARQFVLKQRCDSLTKILVKFGKGPEVCTVPNRQHWKDSSPVYQLVFTASLCFHKHKPNIGLNKAAQSVLVYSIILNSIGANCSDGLVILLPTATHCPVTGQHQVNLAHTEKKMFTTTVHLSSHITSSSWTSS